MSRRGDHLIQPRGLSLLSGLGLLIAVAVAFTATMRASDNLDFESGGVIYDAFWDSRLFDGTPGFPGEIRWVHNPSGMPGTFSPTSFETAVETGLNAWEAVDDGFPDEPLVPVVNFAGQTTITDAFALDGVNVVAWRAESPGGTLAVTPCWVLTAPTTTIADSAGNTVMPVDGGGTIPFPGPAGVTYPTGAVVDCGMRFDSLDTWSTSAVPAAGGFDVQAVAAHEGGHFIGVSHSTLGDFTAADPMSATMLPLAAPGDANFRTLEEDDRAAVLRVYARNRYGAPLAQTVGNRGVIQLTLLKDGNCAPAAGVSVVAYRTSGGINGLHRVETFSGSQFRTFTPHQPFNGSVTLNVPPLPAGESYTIYARTLEAGTGALSSQRYNYTTINSNLIDPENQSRTFDQLATISSLAAGEVLDLGSRGILGCWPANPGSQVNLVAQSATAPATAYKGSAVSVSSVFTNQGSVAAGAFEAGVYFSADATVTPSDIFSGFTCAVPGLAPGASGSCDGPVPIPAMVVPGNYYIGLLVDRQNQISENAESDNGVAAANPTTILRNPLDPIVNGSFETGDLTGWMVKELTPKSNPSLPLSVHGAGVEYPAAQFLAWPYFIYLDFFTSAPTDGQYAALHDFNGDDPATNGFVNRRELYQDVTLPATTTTLEFDYRAAWELFRFNNTQDRTFSVEIEPAGGGPTLLSRTILVAPVNTYEEDTDNPSGGVGDYPPAVIDLSAFGSQGVRLKFVWNVAEPGTGFGFFQLDNIRLNTSSVANTPPTVTISSPASGASATVGQAVTFAGSANDPEDGAISANLTWSSDLDGVIGSGSTFSTSALSVGAHTITASATDSGGLSGSASIAFTVNLVPGNTAPTVSNHAVTSNEDTPVGVILSGSDAEQCELQFAIVSAPTRGAVSGITSDGCTSGAPHSDTAGLTYTPGADFNGSDSFTYSVSDGSSSANATVVITVNAVNDAPIAADRGVTTVVGSAVTVVMAATDVDGCELAFSVVQGPSSGALGAVQADACLPGTPSSDTARITYTPDSPGTYTFTYKGNDGLADSNTAIVTVTVNPAPPATIHVGDLDGASVSLGKGSWMATVSAAVHDPTHGPAVGVTVNGLWSGGASGTGSCTTDATGRCSISSPSIGNAKKNATFTVTAIVNGAAYAASDNHDPDGDSTGGTAIVVRKP